MRRLMRIAVPVMVAVGAAALPGQALAADCTAIDANQCPPSGTPSSYVVDGQTYYVDSRGNSHLTPAAAGQPEISVTVTAQAPNASGTPGPLPTGPDPTLVAGGPGDGAAAHWYRVKTFNALGGVWNWEHWTRDLHPVKGGTIRVSFTEASPFGDVERSDGVKGTVRWNPGGTAREGHDEFVFEFTGPTGTERWTVHAPQNPPAGHALNREELKQIAPDGSAAGSGLVNLTFVGR